MKKVVYKYIYLLKYISQYISRLSTYIWRVCYVSGGGEGAWPATGGDACPCPDLCPSPFLFLALSRGSARVLFPFLAILSVILICDHWNSSKKIIVNLIVYIQEL